jgi:hypothetical protein
MMAASRSSVRQIQHKPPPTTCHLPPQPPTQGGIYLILKPKCYTRIFSC